MNTGVVVLGCVLLAIACALFVFLQFLKEHNQKTESLLGLAILLSGAMGMMVLVSGLYDY